jgi:hypothetical protein
LAVVKEKCIYCHVIGALASDDPNILSCVYDHHISYIHPFVADTDLSMRPQLIQRFIVHITSNEYDLKTNPPPHKRNKFVASPTPRCAIVCVTERRAAAQSKPLQIPEYDAVRRRGRLGSASDVALGDVELLEVREEDVGGGGRHHGVKKR